MNPQHDGEDTPKPPPASGATAALPRSRQRDEAGPAPAGPPRRRLPAVPVPLSGESLFSWVDHLAFSYEVDRTQIMNRLGLEPKTAHAFRLARHTAETDGSRRHVAARRNGTEPGGPARHDAARFRQGERRPTQASPRVRLGSGRDLVLLPTLPRTPRPMAVAVVSVVGGDVSRPRSLYGVPLPRLRLSVLSVDPALGRAGTVPRVPRPRR